MARANTAHIAIHWSPTEAVTDLERAHLWLCDLDEFRDRFLIDESVLSAEEHLRLDRLRSREMRRRFVARCVFVRRVLGGLLGIDPGALDFRAGICGKPELATQFDAGYARRSPPRFNLSHSENVLALAVAFHCEVGVDVERVRADLDFLELAEPRFAPEEIRQLRALPARQRAVPFYRAWTRHEATAKATGRGIALPPYPGDQGQAMKTVRLLSASQRPNGQFELPNAGSKPNRSEAALSSFECDLGAAVAIGSLALCYAAQPSPGYHVGSRP